jgi:uncharacterized protein Veg
LSEVQSLHSEKSEKGEKRKEKKEGNLLEFPRFIIINYHQEGAWGKKLKTRVSYKILEKNALSNALHTCHENVI